MAGQPWFKFNPREWLGEVLIGKVTLEAEGAWIRIVCALRQEGVASSVFSFDELAILLRQRRWQRAVAIVRHLGAKRVAQVDVDEAKREVTITSRRLMRELPDEEARRAGVRERVTRYRQAHVTPLQNGACNAFPSRAIARESRVQSPEESSPSAQTPDALLPSVVACLAPSSPVPGDSAPAPDPALLEALEEKPQGPVRIPDDLRRYERWWRLDGIAASHRKAQVKFVAGFEAMVDEFVQAFPALGILDEFDKAYAWESANERKRKTPSGRKRFLFAWLERAQNGRRA